jgi:phage/plasmid-associated DNA primase
MLERIVVNEIRLAEVEAEYEQAEREPNGEFNRTDAGNSKRLVSMFGDRLRYVPAWGFMWYDGIKWKQVDEVFVQGLAKQTLSKMEDEAVALRKSDDKTARERGTRLEAWVLTCEYNSHIRNMVLLSRDLLLADVSDFDQDGLLINMLDCTFDVRTGETHNHRASDMLTKVAGAAFYAESDGSRFEQFIDEVFGGNEALKQYVQETFGYAMTDVTREEHFWLAYGSGANGKTTLYEVTATAMGDYAVVGRTDMIIEQRNPRKDFDLPTMVGARRVTFKETKPGQKLNEDMIKGLTDGSSTLTEEKFKKPFRFRPHFKMHLHTNDPLVEWLNERTVNTSPTERVNGQNLYSNYEDWYQGPRMEKLDYRVFGKLLKAKGYASKRSNGVTWYFGIAINEDVETTFDRRQRERQERWQASVDKPNKPEDDDDPDE